jgi:hypothetical protein
MGHDGGTARGSRRWEVLRLLTRRLEAQDLRISNVVIEATTHSARRPTGAGEGGDEQTLAEMFARIDTHRGGRLTLEEAADLIRADRDTR